MRGLFHRPWIILLITAIAPTVFAAPPLQERSALEDLYTSTGGPQWFDASGWLEDADPCQWFGVTCDAGGDHVTGLALPLSNMRGELPGSLGNLTALQVLDLADNWLVGGIPTSLGSLTALEVLNLSLNRLTGAVPASLGATTSLRTLDLRSNALAAELPGTLLGLTALTDGDGLDLRWNALHTLDPTLASFLDSKQVDGDWQATQTVAPTDLHFLGGGIVASATWNRIAYEDGGGRYELLASSGSGGPYEHVMSTADSFKKDWPGALLGPLVPDSTLFVVARTVTFPHVDNPKNLVMSDLTDEVEVHTSASTPVWVDLEGDDDNDCRSPDAACQTLTTALEKMPMGWGPVHVAPGDYPEDVVVLRDAWIVGSGARSTRIRSLTIGQWPQDDVVAAVDGLTVQGAQYDGIWMYAFCTMFLRDVEVRDCGGSGIIGDGGTEVLERVTIAGNQSRGMWTFADGTSFTNSTISGNGVSQIGNGLILAGNANLVNTTISGNGAYGIDGTFGEYHLLNTIVAGNGEGSCRGSDAYLCSHGHNLASDDSCALDPVLGDLIGIDPLLLPLADSGGPTRTHALGFGSPAIDAGQDRGMPPLDQRGLGRPQGAGFDIGAHEDLPFGTFADVPPDHWAARFVEAIVRVGITAGCGSGNFCPDAVVSRAQVAVQLVKAIHGPGFQPPPASGVFSDVPADYWAADWIEQLAADGITAGCRPGEFCPENPVLRAQMAVLILKSIHGSDFQPPAAVGRFVDVPVDHWAANWIEQLAAEHITAGCAADRFCPSNSASRAEMAVFITRGFGLPF